MKVNVDLAELETGFRPRLASYRVLATALSSLVKEGDVVNCMREVLPFGRCSGGYIAIDLECRVGCRCG